MAYDHKKGQQNFKEYDFYGCSLLTIFFDQATSFHFLVGLSQFSLLIIVTLYSSSDSNPVNTEHQSLKLRYKSF